MKTSPAGVQAIVLREGYRLDAYQDVRSIWTVGVGHTSAAGPPEVYPTLVMTMAEVNTTLADDLAPVEAALTEAVKVPVTQNQGDALASVTFNIGIGGMRGSSFLKELNAGNYQACADDFMLWTTPKSLTGRRQGERAQFLRADAPLPAAERAQGSIAWIQERLNASGAATLTVDGDLGPSTIAAVKVFQGAHGLVEDGLIGPKTIAALSATMA